MSLTAAPPARVPPALDPAAYTWKRFTVSDGNAYAYIDQAAVPHGRQTDRPRRGVVLFLHGFPELALTWRYQIADLVHRGYRVIVPDLLGYGDTSKPANREAYSKKKSCLALAEILDHEGIDEKIGVVGHDWGSVLACRFVSYFPNRIKFWASICVPPNPPAQANDPAIDWEKMIRRHLPHFGYQLYFMSTDSNEVDKYPRTFVLLLYSHLTRGLHASIEEKIAPFKNASMVVEGQLREQMLRAAKVLEECEVKDPEIEFFVSNFRKDGLSQPLNWYRTRDIDRQDEIEANLSPTFTPEAPCLTVIATNDAALPPAYFNKEALSKLFPGGNLEFVTMEGDDHFLLEAEGSRDKLTKILGDWIDTKEAEFQSKQKRGHL